MSDDAHEANGSTNLADRLAAAEQRIEWLEQQVARLMFHLDAARPQPAVPQMTGMPRSASAGPSASAGRLRRL
jgi:hypothetical protein